MDWTRWLESERYQELTRATRAMDHARQIQIVEEAISETEGIEQAFWRRLRAENSLAKYVRPGEVMRGWDELSSLIAAAPDDLDHLAQMAVFASRLYVVSERTDLWRKFFPQIRRGIKVARQNWAWPFNLGEIRRLQRRPYASMWACTRAIARIDAMPPMAASTQRGRRVFLHAMRARAAAALGHLELAVADTKRSATLYSEYPPAYMSPYHLALAQAEVALAQRQFEAARSALNEGMARASICQHKPQPIHRLEFDLMAARIGRAEGNKASFQHFAERALATCLEWDLRLSEVTVRAVMAGADR